WMGEPMKTTNWDSIGKRKVKRSRPSTDRTPAGWSPQEKAARRAPGQRRVLAQRQARLDFQPPLNGPTMGGARIDQPQKPAGQPIHVTYDSIDGHCETRVFKTLRGARKFAQKWVGEHPDLGSYYAVSYD